MACSKDQYVSVQLISSSACTCAQDILHYTVLTVAGNEGIQVHSSYIEDVDKH